MSTGFERSGSTLRRKLGQQDANGVLRIAKALFPDEVKDLTVGQRAPGVDRQYAKWLPFQASEMNDVPFVNHATGVNVDHDWADADN
jgi:hypothetical protein